MEKWIEDLMEYLRIDSPKGKPIILRFEDKTSFAVFLKDLKDKFLFVEKSEVKEENGK